MTRWNFPHERISVGGKAYPTLLSRPDWDKVSPPMSIPLLGFTIKPPPRPAYISKLAVSVVGPFDERELLPAPSLPEAPATLSYLSLRAQAEKMAPITEPDIVEWMHIATACEVMAEQTEEEYKRAGSYMVARSGDPYIPGVTAEDIGFRCETGRVVANRGTGVLETPRGNLNIPVPGKTTGIFPDLLCWAAITNAWMVQWTGVLTKWLSLTTNPQERIRFPSYAGLVAPQFIEHEAESPAPINFVNMRVSSDRAQTLKVRYREPGDYTQEVCAIACPLSEGENDVSFQLFALPFVSAMAVELVPEDGTSTILDSYSPSVIPF